MSAMVTTTRRTTWLAAMLAAASMAPRPGVGAEEEPAPPRRAKPPAWSRDVLDAFFEDAREQLVGPRPATAGKSMADATPAATGDASGASRFAWSKLVAGETLATEVKRIVAGLREPLSNPAKFKAGGYQQCRLDFSLLAVLFAVIAEHDGDVRWQDDAPALRQALARAGQNCKTATDQTFAESQARKTDLDDVIRGERLAGDAAGEPSRWSDVADRTLLMQRMQTALEERLTPQLGSNAAFQKALADVRHEAELLAMLAEIIQREDYEYWDDDTFHQYSGELRAAAQDMARAAADENYEAARAAAGRASQACSNCHEGYRG